MSIRKSYWFSSSIAAFTASALLFSFSRETLNGFPFYIYFLPFAGTYIGYSLIHFLDEKRRPILNTEGILFIISLLSLLLGLSIFPLLLSNIIYLLISIILLIWYILPFRTFRLRDYWWAKSLTITIVWLCQSCFLYKTTALLSLISQHYPYLLTVSLLCIAACWAYDIQDSKWSEKKIRTVKYLSITCAIGATFFIEGLVGIKKGVFIFLFGLFVFHISQLKKRHSTLQNPLIDFILGLLFLFL